jgi:sugar lactone lactonase YvrE
MINIQDSSLLVIVSISLFFFIIYQIPNSYSQLYSNENIANTFEKEVNKGTYNSNNNNENFFDNGSDNLKTDNFNDKNAYLYLDNISNQESVSKTEDNEDFNLKDYAQSIKQLYKKQTNNQELVSDKSLYYKQNNNNNIPYPSVNDNDLNTKNDDNGYDSYNQQSVSESSSGSKSISSQGPSVDTHYVQVFDKNGNFIKSWGETGNGEGNFLHPHGIAVDSKGYVYVTDEMRSKVLKFDSDGNFIKEWGEKGNAIDQFSPRIEDIDVDSQGNVYVVDYGKTTKILKFDSEGNFIFSLGSKGEGIGEFKRPWGVNVDSEGNIYVAEKLNYRISKYSPDGQFITAWGKNSTADGDFKHLHAVAVDSNNYVYATDEDKGGVQKFTSDGQFITKWGQWGKNEGEMREVHGIATDSEGNVYVADTKNSRIQKFTSDGELVTIWGRNGLGDGKFLMIHDIDIDSNDNVYVIDQRGAHPDKSNAEKYLKIDKEDLDYD